jgi:hypothetical protein
MTRDLYPSIQFDPCPHSNKLLIGFASMQLYQEIPDYEWHGNFSKLDAHRLYVRDNAQFYYLRGLDGVAADIDGSVPALRRITSDIGIAHAACFGASIGGYAALLFGNLLGVDEVHAFSPMTILPSRKLIELLRLVPSQNWKLMMRNLELRHNRSLERPYRDLRPILARDNGRTVYHIYYGRGHTPDRRNAERLAGLPRVHLHPYGYNKHYLVGHLKKSGELDQIMEDAYRRMSCAQPVAA